jgi:uncharacterized membrane protein YgcG
MKIFRKFAGSLILLTLVWAGCAWAQTTTGGVQGQVTDESGAVIPGAAVRVTNSAGVAKIATAGADGSFRVVGLAPGQYTVRVTAGGMAAYENTAVQVRVGTPATLNVSLSVSMEKQEVTVQDQAGAQVSTEPSNNAGQLTLQGADLDALSDDPDDLQSDLEALAGPSAGPNGGQIYIDGFSDGRLPPKESIREIRINQNPFSAEFDHLGYGRIEIFTKPGSDKFHGTAFFNYTDDVFDARNPFAENKAPFEMRTFGGNFGGPLGKKASFFLDFERRLIDDNAVIDATVLGPTLNITPFSQAVQTPQERTTISPRLDYQLSTNNTLTARYTFLRSGQDDSGIGQFTLPQLGYKYVTTQQTAQLTETAVINGHIINETRFQFIRAGMDELGNSAIPTINVAQAFVGGGEQVGHSYDITKSYELQNFTSIPHGSHAFKFGFRVRAYDIYDVSPQNFGGTFTFTGGLAPVLNTDNQAIAGQMEQISSIERYQRTLMLEGLNFSPDLIRQLGGGPSQFTIATGQPETSVVQADVSLYAQDDWRIKQNLTLSLGLRYENQTNIKNWDDVAPRLGIAWAPGAKANRPGKTVIRGGFGIFYDRFLQTSVLQADRFNGITQQQYIVDNPNFACDTCTTSYNPLIPPLSQLGANATTQAVYTMDPTLHAPYTMQTAIGVERQLPKNTTMAVTYTSSRARHLLLMRDINAPLPGTYNEASPGSGLRPYGDVGDVYQFESVGVLNQNQMIVNLTSRMNRSFTLFTFYMLNFAKSDTDGVSTYAANPYDLAQDYGRAAIDVRNRFVLGGSFVTKLNLRLSPFIMAHSGAPFNITTGADDVGDGLFNARPAFATGPGPGVVSNSYGNFILNPTPGETIIPRNYGNGASYFTVNLRLSRTFGFGPHREASANNNSGGGGGGGRGPGGGGPGGGGGMRMGGGGGRGMLGDATTDQRFNLVLSISARNLLNSTNGGPYTGNLTSPIFGQANQLATSFGPASAAGNRRLELQVRFMF